MVIPITITALWLPILVAAVLVFVMSSIIHMFLNYHRNDFARLPDEDRVMDALRPFDIPPGDYVFPFAGGMEAMKSEAYQQKVAKGPVAFVTVLRPGAVFSMGSQLTQWFAYCLLVGIVSAYLAGRMLPLGAAYLQVFRVTGTVAFACYSMALMQRSIWWSQNWSATLRSMFDGLMYAVLTAGAFGWLWPN
jgi:lipoprotein signal peptidase